jgi:hypothetical protein
LSVAAWFSLVILLSPTAREGRPQTGDGLLGVPWGTSLARMRERFRLVPADSDEFSTRYTSDIRSVGGAEVEECILEFRRGAFAGAAVLTWGARNSHRLLAHLRQVFGKGREESERACQWFLEDTHLFYDEDSEGDGYIYWYSRVLFSDLPPEHVPIQHPHREQPR